MIDRRRFATCIALAIAGTDARPDEVLPPAVYFMALATRESDAASVAAFRRGMRELGYQEGQSYRLQEHYAAGNIAQAEATLRAQADRPPAVFVAPGPAAARIILRVHKSVPIVAVGLHPRGGQSDLFASLARPGGQVTGVSNFGEQLAAKRVQLLAEAVPGLRRVGVLHNTTDPVFQRWGEETEREVRLQGFSAERLGLHSTRQVALAATLQVARKRGVEAIIVVRDFLTSSLYRPIAHISRDVGLAVMAEERRYVEAGGLMSYGTSDREQFHQAAGYVDRLLRGASAADMPIRQPTEFELLINRTTADALGLKIPYALLLQAREVLL